LEQERHTKIQLQEEVTAKDAQLHELEMEVKTQQERTKSLAEQVSSELRVHMYVRTYVYVLTAVRCQMLHFPAIKIG